MAILNDDKATQLAFSISENKGIYAFLLGSGVSRSAHIPTGWDITLDLVRKAAVATGEKEQADWNEWHKKKFGHEPSYSELLDDVTTMPSERRKILESYIEPTDAEKNEGKKLPTAAHRALAQLVRDGYVRVILTTNFDRLMETALADAGIQPTVISSVDSINGAEPLIHSSCYLIKLHGDYKDFRILNTEDELSEYPDKLNDLLDRVFDEFGLIICGWSGDWDSALKGAILRAPSRRYATYWATQRVLSGEAKNLAAHRKAEPIIIENADSFFSNLADTVGLIESTSKLAPRAVNLIVEKAKTLVLRPDRRVELADLASEEANRLLTVVSTLQGNCTVSFHNEDFINRVGRLESASEPLAKLAGVLGRWGEDDQYWTIVDLLKSINTVCSRSPGGVVSLQRLGGYPLVLILVSYCLGLLKARRWRLFASILTEGLGKNGNGFDIDTSHFFPGNWDGAEKSLWKLFNGLERKRTPFNLYLRRTLEDWSQTFLGAEPNFDFQYARFEMLSALVFFQTDTLDNLIQSAKNDGRYISPMPYSIMLQDYRLLSDVKNELHQDKFKRELRESGLLSEQDQMLELFFKNIDMHSRLQSVW